MLDKSVPYFEYANEHYPQNVALLRSMGLSV